MIHKLTRLKEDEAMVISGCFYDVGNVTCLLPLLDRQHSVTLLAKFASEGKCGEKKENQWANIILKKKKKRPAQLAMKQLNGGCTIWNSQPQHNSSIKSYATEHFKSLKQQLHKYKLVGKQYLFQNLYF